MSCENGNSRVRRGMLVPALPTNKFFHPGNRAAEPSTPSSDDLLVVSRIKNRDHVTGTSQPRCHLARPPTKPPAKPNFCNVATACSFPTDGRRKDHLCCTWQLQQRLAISATWLAPHCGDINRVAHGYVQWNKCVQRSTLTHPGGTLVGPDATRERRSWLAGDASHIRDTLTFIGAHTATWRVGAVRSSEKISRSKEV